MTTPIHDMRLTPQPAPPDDGRQIVTYSMLHQFRNCRRACYARYVEQLRVATRPPALAQGDLVHRCLEHWHTNYAMPAVCALIAQDEITGAVTRQQAAHTLAMMSGYAAIYRDDSAQWRVLGLELPFYAEIINPATGANSRKLRFAGKVDGVIATPDGTFLIENKTTSRLDAGYIDKLWSDMQIMAYSIFVEQAYGVRVDGVLYNVLEKKRIDQREGESDAEFEARKLEAKAPGRCKQRTAETDEEFAQRLCEAYAYPSNYHREILYFSRADLDELRAELWELGQQFLLARREDGYAKFYRNTSQCFTYNRACDYVPLCRSGWSEAVLAGEYTRGDEAHPELSACGGNGTAMTTPDQLAF